MSRRILVDTHFVLWLRIEPNQLTLDERGLLERAELRYVSIVSLWEIGIMQTVGRLRRDDRLLETPPGFDLMSLGIAHCQAYAALPLHHRDPFDRMLVAQAKAEGVPLLTRDARIGAYHQEATILRNSSG